MGYITPFRNFQYEQYNERVIDQLKKRDPMPIETIHQVNNEIKYKKNKQKFQGALVNDRLYGKKHLKGKHVDKYV